MKSGKMILALALSLSMVLPAAMANPQDVYAADNTEYAELLEQKNTLESEIAEAEASKTELEKEIEELENTIEDLTNQLETYTVDKTEMISEVTAEKEKLEEELAALEDQKGSESDTSTLEELQSQIAEKEAEVAQYKATVTSLTAELDEINQGITDTRTAQTEKSNEINAVTNQISLDTIYKSDTESSLETTETMLSAIQSDIDTIQESLDETEAAIAEWDAKIDVKEAELEELNAEALKLETAKEKAEAAWVSEQERYNTATASLQQQIQGIEDYLQENPDVTTLQENYANFKAYTESEIFGLMQYISENGETDEIKYAAELAYDYLTDNTGKYENALHDWYTFHTAVDIPVNIGEGDEGNLENVKAAVTQLKVGNKLRVNDDNFPNKDPLKISLVLMATATRVAAIHASYNFNAPDNAHGEKYLYHMLPYSVGENLTTAVVDPFKMIYTWEKNNYDTQNGLKTGHYLTHMGNSDNEDTKCVAFGGAVVGVDLNGVFVEHMFYNAPEYGEEMEGYPEIGLMSEDEFLAYIDGFEKEVEKLPELQELIDNADLTINNVDKREELAELKKELEKLAPLDTSLETASISAATAYRDACYKITDTQDVISGYETERNNNYPIVESYNARLTTLNSDKTEWETLKESQEAQIAEYEANIEANNAKLITLNAEAETLAETLATYTANQRIKNSALEEAKGDLEYAEYELGVLQTQLEGVQKELEDKGTDPAYLKLLEDISNTKKAIAELENMLNELNAEGYAFKDDAYAYTCIDEELITAYHALQESVKNELKTLTDQKTEAETSKASKESEVSELEYTIETKKTELESVLNRIEEIRSEAGETVIKEVSKNLEGETYTVSKTIKINLKTSTGSALKNGYAVFDITAKNKATNKVQAVRVKSDAASTLSTTLTTTITIPDAVRTYQYYESVSNLDASSLDPNIYSDLETLNAALENIQEDYIEEQKAENEIEYTITPVSIEGEYTLGSAPMTLTDNFTIDWICEAATNSNIKTLTKTYSGEKKTYTSYVTVSGTAGTVGTLQYRLSNSSTWKDYKSFTVTSSGVKSKFNIGLTTGSKTYSVKYFENAGTTDEEKAYIEAKVNDGTNTYFRSKADAEAYITSQWTTYKNNYWNEKFNSLKLVTRFKVTTVAKGYQSPGSYVNASSIKLNASTTIKVSLKEIVGKTAKLTTAKVSYSNKSSVIVNTLNRKTKKAIKGVKYTVYYKMATSSTWVKAGTRTTDKNGNITVSKTTSGSFQLSANNYNYYTNYSSLVGSEKKKADANIKTGKYFKTKADAQAAYNKDVAARKKTEASKKWNLGLKASSVPSGYKLDTSLKVYNLTVSQTNAKRQATFAPK